MRRRRASNAVQMFSFLDAMVCTMGALLVLLHAFARHGTVEATRKAEAFHSTQTGIELKTAQDDVRWRTEQLKEARARTEAQLNDERLRLSHVEEHQRRLVERLNQLKIAAEALAHTAPSTPHQRQQSLAELESLRKKIEQAKEALESARRRAQAAAVTYSVVPYEGPNGTRRRPVYIECKADVMVIQGTDVEINIDDFSGSFGAGNPLASAVRSIREHWARQAAASGTMFEEPYPLLIVRPEGVEMFYYARRALESWGGDFGYELVAADWQLQYPQLDAQVAAIARNAVAESRVRMRELSAVLGPRGRGRQRPALHASAKGGFVHDRSELGSGASKRWTAGGNSAERSEKTGKPDKAGAADGSDGPLATGTQDSKDPQNKGGPQQLEMELKKSKTASMAKSRGHNWGLPNKGIDGSATRPMLVECHPDRLVIASEDRNVPRREVRFSSSTQDSMDEFVSNVWQHMKTWGSPGKGLHWRPTLVVDVKPGAAERYAEIKALLADSGLDVQDRQSYSTAGQQPNTTRH